MRAALVRRLLKDTLYFAAEGAADVTGNGTPAAPVSFRGRVVYRTRRLRDKKGDDVVSRSQVHTLQEITTQHYVWLPGADQTKVAEAVKPRHVQMGSSLASGLLLYEVFL